MDSVLRDSFEKLLGEVSTPKSVRQIESGGSTENLWKQVEASGFADAMLAEHAGGAGLALNDAFALFFLCGRHALPAPLAQTMVARRACAHAGLTIPEGPIAISPMPVTFTEKSVECRNVPFGKVARWVVISHSGPDGPATLLLPADKATRADNAVHGSLQSHLTWENPSSAGLPLKTALPWLEMAATITAAQIAGAMDAILEMTVRYAGDRSQFGKPIAKFQAIQQQLSILAELAAASRMAAELGCREYAVGKPNPLAAAVAKARTSEAAGTVVSIAHAVHGAMGITEEYDLQLHTRRLIEWRIDYGSAAYWHRRVGDAVLASTAPCTLEFMLPAFFRDGNSS